jgi:hypothetical protein
MFNKIREEKKKRRFSMEREEKEEGKNRRVMCVF